MLLFSSIFYIDKKCIYQRVGSNLPGYILKNTFPLKIDSRQVMILSDIGATLVSRLPYIGCKTRHLAQSQFR